MERGSKLAIHKLKLVEPKEGQPFYKAVVFEKVYNSKKTVGGNWETAFYDAYIFNMDIELEEADRSLGINEKDKFSFDNIANPDKSVIRVIDFKYENQTAWRNNKQLKTDDGKPIVNHIFYLTEIIHQKGVWKSQDRKIRDLEKQIEEEKMAKKDANAKAKAKFTPIIADLKAKIAELQQEIKELNKMSAKKEKIVSRAEILAQTCKEKIKQANRETMVYKRKNTITNNQLEKTQTKLQNAKQEVKEVKKMKTAEVIEKADVFDIDFGDL